MTALRAVYRLALILVVLIIGTIVILALSWLPVRRAGIRLAAWPSQWMAQRFLQICRVGVDAPAAATLQAHEGLVFANHQSYLDIVVLVSVLPVRFLAKHDVRRYPLLGWVARAIGTVFVDRGDRASRQRARVELARTVLYPPVVIFPEGLIPASPMLQPFRYGAFEIAILNGTPILPCVIMYDRQQLVHWGDESLLGALWRLAGHSGTVSAQLELLPILQPRSSDLPALLALQTHEAMASVLTPVLNRDA